MDICLSEKANFIFPALIEALMAPAKYPGSSGSRNLKDNISDLRAQVAANQKVIFPSYIFFKCIFWGTFTTSCGQELFTY